MTEATDIFTSYEEVPYEAVACEPSHPGKLAAMATVMGLPTPPVARCRVLELGCGVGANALPIAADLPDAEIVAIDRSERQIAIAQRAAADLGLRNVDFRRLDILDVGADLGSFDYVIAHGIYSWVPPPVRDRVLAICAERLTPDGLAFISYNTLPGCHLSQVLRDYLLFHLRGVAGPGARVAGSDEGLAFLRDAVGTSAYPPARFIGDLALSYKSALDRIGANRDAALHHDVLAEIYDSVYVRDFAAHAARHQMQYVVDARRWQCIPAEMPPEIRYRLDELAHDPVEHQQYLDFFTMRQLRQTVLCRAHAKVARAPQADRLRGLYVHSTLKPASPHPELHGLKAERFASGNGSIKAAHHVTKAALCHLAAVAPCVVRFDELLAAAGALLGQVVTAADADELARTLLAAAVSEHAVVFFEAHPPAVAHDIAERPRARDLARWQLRSTHIVTNHHHDSVTLEPLQASVLERLDGTRDRAALLTELVDATATTKLVRNGKAVPAHQVRSVLARDLDVTLTQLAQHALLSAEPPAP